MSEVGALIVKLRAETAEFKSDLGKVKSDLDGLKDKSQETGEAMDHSFTEARGGLMLTEDLVGVRLPRHLNTLIAQIPGVGVAFSMMLPIVGVAVAIEIISKLIEKHKEAAESAMKLRAAQETFGIAAQEAFNKLDDKLLEAGIKADELAGNHLGALHKRLLLIDHQSMSELVAEFSKLSDAADKTLGAITEHWYESKIGVVGVKDALNNFKLQYQELLAQHKDKEAGDLLAGTLQSAIKMKELMEAQQGGHGSTQSDLDAQKAWIGLLQTEVALRQKSVQLVKEEKQNEVTEDAQKQVLHVKPEDYKEWLEARHKKTEAAEKLNEEQLAADAEFTKAEQTLFADQAKYAREAALQQREQRDLSKEADAKAGIDKLDAAYRSGLVGVREFYAQKKALMQADLQAQADYARAEREVAQQQLDAANAGNGNDPSVLTARIEAMKHLAEATRAVAKAQEELSTSLTKVGQEESQNTSFIGALTASMQQSKTFAAQMGDNMQHAMSGFNTAVAKSIVEGKNFGQAMRQVGIQVVESIIQQILAQEEKMLIDRLVTGMHIAGNAQASASDKATAGQSQLAWAKVDAVKAYNAFAGIPIIGPELGAVAAAATFASMMAFESGGIVPGTGSGDTVPAMLSPQEMVLPRPISQGLQTAIASGGMNGGGTMHLHAPAFAPKVSAVDAAGMDRVLKKHADKFAKQFHSEMRKRGH
jgi:hypothetical protein